MADNKDPSYPWYPRDFAADELVIRLGLEEEGAFHRLLDHQWLHESIPSDLGDLARICKNISARKMGKMWASLKLLFPVESSPGRLQNRRLERVRQDRKEYREKKSTAGKLGADAAWGEGESGQGKRYVYALQRTTGGPFKIGVSRSPSRRADRLGEGLGAELVVVAQCEGGFGLERASQVELAAHRVGTEWFADTSEVRAWITCHISALAEPRHRLGSDQGEPSPALALASASALASPPTPQHGGASAQEGHAAIDKLRNAMPPDYREDLDALLARVKDPAAWCGDLTMTVEGGTAGPGVIYADLGQALHDYRLNGKAEEPNIAHFRTYVRRAAAERRRHARADPTRDRQPDRAKPPVTPLRRLV